MPLERAGAGFEEAIGGRREPGGRARAVDENWIKAYPCCLQTHGAIEAAARAREAGADADVSVHPLSLEAAAEDEPADGLQAKFSIPYLIAFTLLHGAPTVASFDGVDAERGGARRARSRCTPTASCSSPRPSCSTRRRGGPEWRRRWARPSGHGRGGS